MRDKRILLVGDDSYEMYVKAFYNAFINLGYKNVRLFATNNYMVSNSRIGKLVMRTECKFAMGYRVWQANHCLLEIAREMQPDLVFLYTARLIFPETIKKLKEEGATIFLYNNDDPFADFFPKYYWRHYLGSIRFADTCFVYRYKNLEECKQAGCENVEMLRSYYIKERNYFTEENKLSVPKVLFLGHNEPDEREEYIAALLDAGIEVGVMKKSWEVFRREDTHLIKLEDSHLYYNEMLNGTEIAIVFLSKINNDTYTRRCFEIPATKTLMIAPYNEDLASLFVDGKEAVFYRNKEEFVSKIQYYLQNKEERQKIAEAGFARVMRDGHSAESRIEFIMDRYAQVVGVD